MWPLVKYSNYFKTLSTMTNQTHFQVAMFALTLYYCMIIIHGTSIQNKNFEFKKGVGIDHYDKN